MGPAEQRPKSKSARRIASSMNDQQSMLGAAVVLRSEEAHVISRSAPEEPHPRRRASAPVYGPEDPRSANARAIIEEPTGCAGVRVAHVAAVDAVERPSWSAEVTSIASFIARRIWLRA